MLKYRLSFQIHYKANYEQFIVLVGNCPQLGDWDVNKGLKLDWCQVNFNIKH